MDHRLTEREQLLKAPDGPHGDTPEHSGESRTQASVMGI